MKIYRFPDSPFVLHAPFEPAGDQPKAIEELVNRIERGEKYTVLLGATGTGKTYTLSHVIARVGKPTLVLSHNKTLAAQLYGEFKGFFPENAVEYFISYYDYYQPEAYIPQTDTYIPKEATINDDIERLRLRTVASLLTRKDVIVVASVSAIYPLDDPEYIKENFLHFRTGNRWNLKTLTLRLVELGYERNDIDLQRGRFRLRGDVLDVIPAYEEFIVRVEFWGDEIDSIKILESVSLRKIADISEFVLYPATHFLGGQERLEEAIKSIEKELQERLRELRAQGKFLEAQRLEQRTRYDLELLRTTGTCPGIENYSRHISGRAPGERPWTLLDYFPEDYLLVIDESHVTIPQLRAMYEGDRSRKLTLIEHGFRLPSALDNRPLKFEELESLWPQVVFMSATPGPYELKKTKGKVVEQIVRPTGIPDPIIEVRPLKGMMDDLLEKIRHTVERDERVLITTLTKRSAEEVSDYLLEMGIRAAYLHSELDAIERVKILRDLRLGEIDVLVGVNLLREGLDLPEVSLVAIIDADKSGFLRSYTALIQTIGRAARNAAGCVILYAGTITEAMEKAISETERRRHIQLEYNQRYGIVPKTVEKSREDILRTTGVADERLLTAENKNKDEDVLDEIEEILGKFKGKRAIKKLKALMLRYAENLEYEKAAVVRDKLRQMGEIV
ncbi:MAG: excinuclease ABC subunit B [Thermotogae bacterium]|nr:excinuclease ABC subunit B [Thermotogota bacterium]